MSAIKNQEIDLGNKITIDSIDEQLARIQFSVEHSRLLQAHQETVTLYEMVFKADESEAAVIRDIISANKEFLEKVECRAKELGSTIDMCSADHSGWTLGSEMFGVSTYYRVEEDGLLSVRMEGVQEIPIFEQIIVFYECDLYREWIPFCKESRLLKKISK